MCKVLNVAEKNDAAKSIAGVMSNGSCIKREGYSKFNKIYEFPFQLHNQNVTMIMTSVSGHLLSHEFAGSYKSWQGCKPVELFSAEIVQYCKDDYMPIKRTLEREAKNCKKLIIWTDCDREGEGIGQEIIEVCMKVNPRLDVYRAVFSEITKTSIMRAIRSDQLKRPDKNVSDAVEARSELDLRIGAAFTRFQTLRLQKVFPSLGQNLLSYGSCQFPTLGFVVERYNDRQNFQSEPFWKIQVKHMHNDREVEFTWERNRLFDYNACRALYNHLVASPIAQVINIITKPKSKWRPNPLDTIELEKSASRKLKINAKETMKIAETLYTKGFISYPRTETNIFPKDFDLNSLVRNQVNDGQWGNFASRLMERGATPRNGTKSDQAHPPIHPTKYTDSLQGNEKLVYEFIVRHFLATCSQDAKGFETVVLIGINGEHFTTSGLMITERNYLEVYKYDRWSDKEVPVYEENTEFIPDAIELKEGQTEAPQLLTEADLIALMEKHGIGTDATHAEHIETIKERSYVYFEQNRFRPAEIGQGLVEGYDSMGYEMSKPDLRARLEDDLKAICEGKKTKAEVLRLQIDAYKRVFMDAVANVEKLDEAMGRFLGQRAEIFVEESYCGDQVLECKCKSAMVLKKKKEKNSFYLSCRGYPNCKTSVWFPDAIVGATVIDEKCEKCAPKDVNKINFKFDKKQVPFTLPANYTTCIICDSTLREHLGIDISQLSSDCSIRPSPLQNRSTNISINSSGYQSMNQSRNNSNLSAIQTQKATPKNNYNNSSTRNYNTSNTSRSNTPDFQNNSRKNNNELSDNPTVCYCGIPAAQRTVRKEGPTFGRLFLSCNNQNNRCDFFAWDERGEGDSSGNGGNGFKGGRNSGGSGNEFGGNGISTGKNGGSSYFPSIDKSVQSQPQNGVMMCSCKKAATVLTVKKEGPNQGRKFAKCDDCKFFEWDDGPSGGGNSASSQPMTSRNKSPFSIKKRAKPKS